MIRSFVSPKLFAVCALLIAPLLAEKVEVPTEVYAPDSPVHRKVGKIARLMLDGIAPMDLTGGATHYHTKAVKPKWSRVFPRTTTIGYHHFYREPSRIASQGRPRTGFWEIL